MFRPAFPFPRLGRRPNRTLAHRIARAPTGGTGVNPGQGLVKMPQRRALPGATSQPPGRGTGRVSVGPGAVLRGRVLHLHPRRQPAPPRHLLPFFVAAAVEVERRLLCVTSP